MTMISTTMQHDVFVQPLRRNRIAYPFIVVLQSDYAEGVDRLCAPLVPVRLATVSRGAPFLAFQDEQYSLLLVRMLAIPISQLRRPSGSVAAYRSDILYALDWLFTGI